MLSISNFPLRESNSLTTLLSAKLAWDTDLCLPAIDDNRPIISCRVSVLDQDLRESISDSPITYTPSPLYSKKIASMDAANSPDKPTASTEPANGDDVFCVKINSVAVNGLSCAEKVGRVIRRQNSISKVRS